MVGQQLKQRHRQVPEAKGIWIVDASTHALGSCDMFIFGRDGCGRLHSWRPTLQLAERSSL